MAAQSKLDQIELFVTELMNELQSEHSTFIAALKKHLGSLGAEAVEIENKIYDGKVEVLERVYKKIGGLK